MKIIAWNVDTQYDFMRPDGKLPVPGAESIEPTLEYITGEFRSAGIQRVNTADWHLPDSQELSVNPDYKTTFPEHCMQGTEGAKYVPATAPKGAYIVDWQSGGVDLERALEARDIVLLKDKFDVFSGNRYASALVDAMKPDRAIVYGVATNVCVDFAVRGLIDRGVEVYIVKDAIMGLPGIPSPIGEWEQMGAKMIDSRELGNYLR
jgi:nicotinamidase/pyrazinamidase